MKKYLDPKADLTFKKIFGLHPDLLASPEISRALDEVEVSAFTDDELRAYDKFWDNVRTEKSLLYDSEQKGRAEGRAEGIREKQAEIAANMKAAGMDDAQIAALTGLAPGEVAQVKGGAR